MPSFLPDLASVLLVGLGATALMDAWLLLLARLGGPPASFVLVGRWIGHLARGTLVHAAIAQARPVRAEAALGWLTHYAVGIAYAALLVALVGPAWLRTPTLLPALAWGVATVVVPLFVMQPAMGAGIASRRTATPWRHRLRSLANHTVFGTGLYVAARLVASAAP